jgi:hypothetical protein
MSQGADDDFADLADLGGFLASDFITSPIRRLVRRDAERAGIDLDNPRRSVATLFGSSALGAVFGTILGPIGSILGSLLGYVMALGSTYEREAAPLGDDTGDEALGLLEHQAFGPCVDVLESQSSGGECQEVCDDFTEEIDDIMMGFEALLLQDTAAEVDPPDFEDSPTIDRIR